VLFTGYTIYFRGIEDWYQGRYEKFHVIIFLSHILHWPFPSIDFYTAKKIFELTNYENKFLRELPLFNLQIFFYIENIYWGIIITFITYFVAICSFLHVQCICPHISVFAIICPYLPAYSTSGICTVVSKIIYFAVKVSTQDVDIWMEIHIRHDVYIWANYSVSS
jgi:hypothetical protein